LIKKSLSTFFYQLNGKTSFEKRLIKMELIFLTKYGVFISRARGVIDMIIKLILAAVTALTGGPEKSTYLILFVGPLSQYPGLFHRNFFTIVSTLF
jgi:hypothetical protein